MELCQTARRIATWLKTAFSTPAVLLSLMVSVGIGALGASFFWEDSEPMARFLSSVGMAILSAGVFAATVKSLQLAGVFRNELREVLDDWEQAKKPDEKRMLWVQRTSSLFNWCPDGSAIAKTLATQMGMGADTFGSYYSKCDYRYEVTHYDEATGIYVLSELHTLQLCSDSESKKIVVKFRWQESLHSDQEMKITSLKIDDVDHLNQVVPKVENGKRIVAYTIELHGKRHYYLTRQTQRKSSILVEPFMRLTFSRLAHDISIHVTGAGLKKLRASIQTNGTADEFEDLLPNGEGRLVRFKGPIFPQQGFIVHFSPQDRTAPPAQ